MTTVVAVRKGGQVAIAADTLVTFGDTRLSNRFESNSKLFEVESSVGPTYVGMSGTVAHFPVIRKALSSLQPEELKLGDKADVFETFLKLHPVLKEVFYLQTKEEDHDPYESSQFSVLLANRTGIYGVYSYREVFEFKEFWGIGSGRSFALGAMHAAYSKAKTATDVVEAGMSAACEFDRNSAMPIDMFTIKMKGSR